LSGLHEKKIVVYKLTLFVTTAVTYYCVCTLQSLLCSCARHARHYVFCGIDRNDFI